MVIALVGSAILGGTITLASLAPVLGLKALLVAPFGGSLAAGLVVAVSCARAAKRVAAPTTLSEV
ncbi:hypothetical protein M446_1271 [Methylobacterium sp. 4-46]|uniref:hypothetical protein n=1 Tax=unclassified Methylobacterium TaxID=2615210 RepID=UPI000152BEBA|nr:MULTISPECIES: hypothetical protein [Methylobacterium]ACA15791.1 hypothetical protein M446_1271 [Methylobacterium sp. 4-46]WFT81521.1 hypothetical protein QA634_06455 [Methylobacterium nodulans]